MNKSSKYTKLIDDTRDKICRAEIGVTGVFKIMLETLSQIEKEGADIGPKWVGVNDELPDTPFEYSGWENGVCVYDGMVSQSIEITDGQNWARGHYQSDGVWHMYDESQHDFLNVDPKEVTHWMPMVKLP